MNKPPALLNRTSAELRAMLAGGKTVKTAELIAMAKWAIFREIDDREEDIDVLNYGAVPAEEAPQIISKLEAEAEETEGEHKRLIEEIAEERKLEIETLEKAHQEALIEQAKVGSEITL